MLWYIIDGWNVVHQVAELKNDAAPRQALLTYIKKKRLSGSRNNRVTVVFDGFFDHRDFFQEKDIQVRFSGERSADSVIVEMVARAANKAQIVVVTDDRQIRVAARMHGAQCRKVEEFVRPKEKKTVPQKEKTISASLEREIDKEVRTALLKKYDVSPQGKDDEGKREK